MDEENSLTQETQEEELPAESSQCSKINVKLLPYKSFYFLFFSAVGSIFPYLAIFFRQLLLSARQTGVLIGIRPILQLVSCSAWGLIADRSNKSKYIFLVSLVGWLCGNFSLSLVKHRVDIGPCRDNGSLTVFDNALGVVGAAPFLRNKTFFKRAEAVKKSRTFDGNGMKRNLNYVNIKRRRIKRSNRTWNQLLGELKSNFKNGVTERKIDEQSSFGHPPWSFHTILSSKTSNDNGIRQNNEVFIILLIITIIGTLVAAPAIPFADTATLQVLGKLL